MGLLSGPPSELDESESHSGLFGLVEEAGCSVELASLLAQGTSEARRSRVRLQSHASTEFANRIPQTKSNWIAVTPTTSVDEEK